MRLFSIVNYSGLDLRLKIEYDFFKEIMRKKILYSPEPPKNGIKVEYLKNEQNQIALVNSIEPIFLN